MTLYLVRFIFVTGTLEKQNILQLSMIQVIICITSECMYMYRYHLAYLRNVHVGSGLVRHPQLLLDWVVSTDEERGPYCGESTVGRGQFVIGLTEFAKQLYKPAVGMGAFVSVHPDIIACAETRPAALAGAGGGTRNNYYRLGGATRRRG